MTNWSQVKEAHYVRKDRLLLRLACGHETTITPVETTAGKMRELLESRVPCPICQRIEARIRHGLVEAEDESQVRGRVERDTESWYGERLVRAKPEFL